MVEGTENGFAVPEPRLSPGFEYLPAFDDLLEQISATNVVDADWPILRDMIKHKLAQAIDNFLAQGPPYTLAPEEAYAIRSRAYETIDYFTGPPFTIQRLCELLLYPHSCYRSLPKYLRAVNRVLSVTSDQSTFTEDSSDDPLLVAAVASTSAETLEYHSLGIVHDDKVLSPAHHTHRRSTTPLPSSPSPSSTTSSSSSSSSSSTRTSTPKSLPQVIPLLSPIPWLQKPKPSPSSSPSSPASNPPLSSAFDSDPPSSPSRTNSLSLAIETTRPPPQLHSNGQGSPPKGVGETTTPTGGLVDEVDPGSGGQETVEPVALSSATTNLPPTSSTTSGVGSPSSPTRGLTPTDLLNGREGEKEKERQEDSLRSRFVRASSPRASSVDGGEGNEGEGGGMGGIEERMKED